MLQKEPIGSHPPRFLDVGCCVGQVLRKLTADGVDSSRLYGTDLESRFHDAGYDLFRDRETFKGSFVAGDMLRKTESGRERKSKGASRRTSTDDPLEALDGKMTYIHAASFFHLFTWDEQLRAAIRMQRFLSSTDSTTTRTDSSDSRTRLKAMIFGRQVGTLTPRERLGKQGSDKVYLHNAESWQMLWDEVGALTGTEWAAAMYPIETIRTATPESSLRKMAFCVVRRT
ncbi:hypothetical protein F5Y16DRAFT_381190 [Xylariaceae sp. FL0255]|nr:hypothetical protein F5Y16DRAFT_381190 [Xylariaceae sp. FL0255]